MEQIADSSQIESPCRKICKLDPESRMCIGCKRTRQEIAQWLFFTAAQRRAIMEMLPKRQIPQPPKTNAEREQ